MAGAVQRRCEELAGRGELVVMAGAGVSAGPPSSVPGWNPLNAAIFAALRRRLEAAIDWPGWLDGAEPFVAEARTGGRFPPDYQAQVIEEMCGQRYFQGLQSLDVDVGNAAHEAIAALAAGGALRAVVTTNFDRLIERALERRGVPFAPAFDEAGFAAARESRDGVLPVIKVHGSVSSAGSMVDTWKQRRLGRSAQLTDCLTPLHDAFWVYAGFSAADLDDDDNKSYLGLVAGAGRSPGALYIAFPPNPQLGRGAQRLMAAYGDRGETVIADVAERLAALGSAAGCPPPAAIAADGPTGRALFELALADWAGALTVSAAGLCVAAILEATGAGEPAVRVLDRLVRHELYEERDTPDFRALQVQYGRLGGALGRFIAVPDMGGAASNASVESVQSLFRARDSEAGFLARAWLAPMYLWQGDGAQASDLAAAIFDGFRLGRWEGPQPRSDEEVVDAWASAAQILYFNANSGTLQVLLGTVETALDRARRTGDAVREARVAALHLLALAETGEDLPALARSYEPVFAHAQRVDDGVAFGLRALALGRWHVGVGGLALAAREQRREAVAEEALAFLNEAASRFRALGMHPWLLYVDIQVARALADLGMLDLVGDRVRRANSQLHRFPILASFLYEAVAQIQEALGNEDAATSYDDAVEAALESGLRARHQRLSAIVQARR